MAKRIYIGLVLGLIGLVILSLFLAAGSFFVHPKGALAPRFFVGVEYGWNGNLTDCNAVIDRVKNFTNLFVVSSASVTSDETTLNAACDYAYHSGMYLLVYFSMQNYSDAYPGVSNQFCPYEWMVKAKATYQSHFLGVYFNDEPGGSQLDSLVAKPADGLVNYTESAGDFIHSTASKMHVISYYGHASGTSVFTSDYGLYWFDYKAGYDVVLAQFGWNNSRALQVALARGAANVQNKTWGVIITWTYDQPPYLESGAKLYDDLVFAYDSGAKYVAVYDASKGFQNTTLTQDHFDALKAFWSYASNNPGRQGSLKADTSLVLPQDYGFGFRSPVDSVWGFKQADNWSGKMFDDVNGFLEKYGSRLDIVFVDPDFAGSVRNYYGSVIFWSAT
jgi:hypothetical protein